MKKMIVWTLAAMVFAMPIALAHAEASTQVSVVSANDLKLKRIGEGFNDFLFNVRSFLTFDEKAKLDLLKERNQEMQTQQQEWLQMKAHVMDEIKSGNMTADEKQDLINQIQEEHQTIIKNHLELTSKMRDIQLDAKEKGNETLEQEADIEANESEHSELSDGLSLNGFITVGQSNITAQQAQDIVAKDFGFSNTSVRTETQGNSTFYVVSGQANRGADKYTLEKNFEVWVDSATGVVTSVDLHANVALNSGVSIG